MCVWVCVCVCVGGCACVCAPCLFLSLLIGSFAAAAWSFWLLGGSWNREPSSSLSPSLCYHACSFLKPSPSVSSLHEGPFLKACKASGVTWPELPLQELERVRDKDNGAINKSFHSLLKDSCYFFSLSVGKGARCPPADSEQTHSRWKTRMKGTGALQVESGKRAAYKKLQREERRLLSARPCCVHAHLGKSVHASRPLTALFTFQPEVSITALHLLLQQYSSF